MQCMGLHGTLLHFPMSWSYFTMVCGGVYRCGGVDGYVKIDQTFGKGGNMKKVKKNIDFNPIVHIPIKGI